MIHQSDLSDTPVNKYFEERIQKDGFSEDGICVRVLVSLVQEIIHSEYMPKVQEVLSKDLSTINDEQKQESLIRDVSNRLFSIIASCKEEFEKYDPSDICQYNDIVSKAYLYNYALQFLNDDLRFLNGLYTYREDELVVKAIKEKYGLNGHTIKLSDILSLGQTTPKSSKILSSTLTFPALECDPDTEVLLNRIAIILHWTHIEPEKYNSSSIGEIIGNFITKFTKNIEKGLPFVGFIDNNCYSHLLYNEIVMTAIEETDNYSSPENIINPINAIDYDEIINPCGEKYKILRDVNEKINSSGEKIKNIYSYYPLSHIEEYESIPSYKLHRAIRKAYKKVYGPYYKDMEYLPDYQNILRIQISHKIIKEPLLCDLLSLNCTLGFSPKHYLDKHTFLVGMCYSNIRRLKQYLSTNGGYDIVSDDINIDDLYDMIIPGTDKITLPYLFPSPSIERIKTIKDKYAK